MPEPFLQSAVTYEGKLRLSWIAPAFDTRAIFVAVAEDAEFTVNRRIFLLPLIAEILLTVGSGAWYACIGAAHGTPEQGVVSWSGIHGPVVIETADAQPAAIPFTERETPSPVKGIAVDQGLRKEGISLLPKALPAALRNPTISLPILHHKPVAGAYRFYTGKSDPHVVVFEMGRSADVGTQFSLAKTKWKWVAEKGYMGWTDCWGLRYPDTYAIRVSTFEGSGFPTTTPVLLGPGRTFPNVVCARTPFYRSLEDKQNAKGDGILLQQRKVTPNMKFSSHGEYLRYQAALVRSGHDNARSVGPAMFSEVEKQ